jgi:ferredoxin, 2Fe-2S
MAMITFVQPDGVRTVVDATSGRTVMEAAVRNNIAGIDAECGGGCSCATCHVYVDPQWSAIAAGRSDDESSTLDYATGVKDNSRLCCQIVVDDLLDGLVLHIP